MANRTRSILLRFTPDELDRLDDYCADLRRATGEAVNRSQVVRFAITDWLSVARAPAPPNTHAPYAASQRLMTDAERLDEMHRLLKRNQPS